MSMILNPYRYAFGGGGGAVFGNASREFDGVDDYFEVPEDLFNLTAGTVALWFKSHDVTTFSLMFYSKASGISTDRIYISNLSGNLRGNLDNEFAQGTTTISTGVWYHAGLTWDSSGNGKLYLDGSQEGSTMTGVTLTALAGKKTTIGALDRGVSGEFDGKIADVRIYDTDLSASEMSDLASGTDVPSGLVVHYLGNDDNDDNIANPGTNDGTNNGSTYSTDGPLD